MHGYNYTQPPIGSQFQRLTVLAYSHATEKPKASRARPNTIVRTYYWLCRCECGTERAFRAKDVRQGRTHSCGCYQRERVAATFHQHGACGTPEYTAWQNLKQRCLNPDNREYPNYGGRGITICEGWRDFETFLAGIGVRPDPSLSLDRIDNDGNYSCGRCRQCHWEAWKMNCRWATAAEQTANRERNPNASMIAEVRRHVRTVDMVIASLRIRDGKLLNP